MVALEQFQRSSRLWNVHTSMDIHGHSMDIHGHSMDIHPMDNDERAVQEEGESESQIGGEEIK